MSQWTCERCTFLNHPILPQCDICGQKKPSRPNHNECSNDFEIAKRLQRQFNQELNSNNNTMKPQKTHISSNNSVSNSSVSSINISQIIKTQSNPRKRKRDEMISYNDAQNNNAFSERKVKTVETNINYTRYLSQNDIIDSIRCDFAPGHRARYSNPMLSGKMKVSASGHTNIHSLFSDSWYDDTGVTIEPRNPQEYPYFVMDFKDLRIKPNCYGIKHPIYYRVSDGRTITLGSNNFLRNWSFEGSNDLVNWTRIHSVHNSDTLSRSQGRTTAFQGFQSGFFTKFRFRMTGANSSNNRSLKIKAFRLYGAVRRTIEKKARKNEHKTIEKFPAVSSSKCLGDINNVFQILNESESLQHNECKEYISDITNLKVQLKDYQQRGLQWMLNMENNGNSDGIHGGLLCDEMGLGKTVQMIALMLVQRQNGRKDRSLIITPLSLIDQWITEIAKIAGPNTFKYINYYGSERFKITKSDFENCDIVFSTTQTFSNAIGKLSNVYDHWEQEWWTQTHKQQLIFQLPNNFFRRIIVDESHELKNTKSNKSQSICTFALRCHAKWCLTGTPIKNDFASDMAGMIRYLGIKHETYRKALQLSIKEKEEKLKCDVPKPMNIQRKKNFWLDTNHKYCLNKIETYLTKIMIRRTKKQVLSADFVEKEEIVIKCKLSTEEQIIYDKNANEATEQYQRFKTENSVMRNYLFLLRMLTKLRQICDHCSLVFNRNNLLSANENINTSNVMDLESNIDILNRVEEDIINRLNEMESLIDYECPICYELTELNGVMISLCGHLFCSECIHDLDKLECPMCRMRYTKRNVLRITHILQSKQLNKEHLNEFQKYQQNVNSSRNNLQKNDSKKYEKLILKYSNISHMSSKVNALIQRLKFIKQNNAFKNDKILVFSNFTQFFNIVSRKLNEERIRHLQFHGSMNRKKRKQILDEFKSNNNVSVLLISAKCASVGLNLMCANHVIFLDPRMNPGLDNQAIGRVWRIGQNKKVYVTRIIFENTVEETILKLQQNKENNNESNLVNLKQKAKLNEKDFDIIFSYNSDI